ncbi:MAG TPA: hypothetical protein VMV51_01425 [Gemmatimonadaceae bacterium]|nr:hypothetical protein [Gemmatimonadaceae bacterium]
MRHPAALPPAAPPAPVFHDALRYWERRRIVYNVALALLALGWVVLTWPHFQPAFTLDSLGKLLVLALLANVCYTTAYLVDLPLQQTAFRDTWLRYRWTLFAAGLLLALLFAYYWIGDEIYPSVIGR